MKTMIGMTLGLSAFACITLTTAKAAALANSERLGWAESSTSESQVASDEKNQLADEAASEIAAASDVTDAQDSADQVADVERGSSDGFGAKGSVVGRLFSLWFTTDQAEAKESKRKKHSKHKSSAKKHSSRHASDGAEEMGEGSDFDSASGSDDGAELGTDEIAKMLESRSGVKSAGGKKEVGRGNPALESIRNGTATDVSATVDVNAPVTNGASPAETANNRDMLVSLMRHQREPRYDPLQPLSGRWVRCRETAATEGSPVHSIRDRFSSSDKSHFTHTVSRASDTSCVSVVSEERTNYECSPMNSEMLTCRTLKRETKAADGAWTAAKDFVSINVKLNFLSGVKKYASHSKRRSKKSLKDLESNDAGPEAGGTTSATTLSASAVAPSAVTPSAVTAPTVSTEAIAAMVGRKADTRKLEIKLVPETGEPETYVLRFAPLKATK